MCAAESATRIVVSGLPASGKSTLGAALATALGIRCLDKDNFLEALFEPHPDPTPDDRSALSRKADAQFIEAASQPCDAVLVSWWRHPRSVINSGTPTDWLRAVAGRRVELHCQCDPDVALARFSTRQRHRGHGDAQRDHTALARTFHTQAALGPLGVGHLVPVDTHDRVDVATVVRLVQRASDQAAR
ncbi:MAG: AAA family ATPase [Pseudomonadota bacterium]